MTDAYLNISYTFYSRSTKIKEFKKTMCVEFTHDIDDTKPQGKVTLYRSHKVQPINYRACEVGVGIEVPCNLHDMKEVSERAVEELQNTLHNQIMHAVKYHREQLSHL